MPSNPPGLGWESLVTLTISEWESPTDYTYSVKKAGVSALKVTIAPTEKSYSKIPIKFEVSYEDTNYQQKVTSDFTTKISQLEINESLASVAVVTGQTANVFGDIAPFLAMIFPAFGTLITNFLIVKNMFK